MTDPGKRSTFTLFRNINHSRSPRIAEYVCLARWNDYYIPPPANSSDAALLARIFKPRNLQTPS